MSSELIAVDGCQLSHKSGSLISGGSFVITSVPSTNVKAMAKGIYTGPLAFTFSGGSAAGFVDGSVAGGGSIPATSSEVAVGGLAVMREGDSVLMACVGTIPPPTGGTGPVSGDVEISDAGQSEVKAE